MNFEPTVPENCDVCQTKFETIAYDAKTQKGPWAWMCTTCYRDQGIGLGLGLGQAYKVIDNQWIKTNG